MRDGLSFQDRVSDSGTIYKRRLIALGVPNESMDASPSCILLFGIFI